MQIIEIPEIEKINSSNNNNKILNNKKYKLEAIVLQLIHAPDSIEAKRRQTQEAIVMQLIHAPDCIEAKWVDTKQLTITKNIKQTQRNN